ncbi:MAG: DEAD/DEAH box helicase family protein [Clostridia bacterium]|nr:DEAD/DEAH box helicase family protein [Clostridia bacterium]
MYEVNEYELFYEDEEAGEPEEMLGVSSDEVLVTCLNKLGRVDLEQMSACSGKTCEQLALDLRGSAILQDPAVFEQDECWSIEKGWQTRSQYCYGYIRRKLEIAERMNKRFPGCFEENIAALKKMLPDSLNLAEIHVSLGATWAPAELYSEFAKELLNLHHAPTVLYNKEVRTWRVIPPDEARTSVANTIIYGTSYITALKIIEQTMNAKTVKVFDYIPSNNWNYERVFNKDATLAAQEKQKAIIRAFERWIHEDEKRRLLLEECYNDAFVGYGVSSYDGSFLRFPDMNPDVVFYPHQRNAIARMLLSQEHLLLAHDVGTGKTYEMCAGVHELYRMGLSRKNLVVVPNNVLKATVEAHRFLFPNDRILAIYPKDFAPKHRKAALEKVRDGDHVAVYMAYSSFDMIVMSKNYWLNKMTAEFNELRNAVANASRKEERQMLERQKDFLAKKISTYMMEAVDTPWLTFDQLGIETLVVDEAHSYKNIPLNTKADNIVGMHATGSKKCKEMLEKSRVVKKLIMATGTPLTNSLADLFVLQTYLQADELKFRGIDSFDMWINTFGERETNFEVDVDSKHLRAITRFSTFHNLTELMSLFSTVCDFHHMGENEAELPLFKGYRDFCIRKIAAQAEYMKELSKRTDLIRAHRVKRTEDNLLKITTDGRKCALDVRLVDSECTIADSEENKVKACAERVYRLYCSSPETCQVVFSDIGTPKSSFNVYDCLKQELVALGIPAHQIAFAHDAIGEAARARLFAAINAGIIRVVVGSTAKLGVGVNVQERLVALHHLSVPWRPADMVQREGRIIRRGNQCKEVYIYRYVTEGSFDSYSWQLLENKQRFISSFLSGTSATRDADDVADVVLNYAEVKALAIGNPLIKKRVETANRLERAKIAGRQRQKQLIDLRAVVETAPAELERLKHTHAIVSLDAALYAKCKEVVPQEERAAFGEELLEAIRENHMQNKERRFDGYQGFDVVLPAAMDCEKPHVYIRSVNGGEYPLEMETDKPLGCAMRIDHLLEHLAERVLSLEEQIRRVDQQQTEALADLENGNEYQAEVERLQLALDTIDKQLAKEEKSA